MESEAIVSQRLVSLRRLLHVHVGTCYGIYRSAVQEELLAALH